MGSKAKTTRSSRRSTVRKPKNEVDELLRSKDLMKRLSAVDLLLKKGDKEKLVELLHSESWHLRERSAQALTTFGSDIADMVRPLLDEGYWYVRAVAAYIVGEIGDEDAFDKLKDMLYEKNETVKSRASVALAKLIRKNVSLLERLSLEDKVRLENNLKSMKEFDLIEHIKPVQEAKENPNDNR